VFYPKDNQNAIRVFVGQANTKIALMHGKKVEVESKPQDGGKSNLLIAENLEVGAKYELIFEFTERSHEMDGMGAIGCETFVLAVKTWDSKKVCDSGLDKTDVTQPIKLYANSDPSTT
jgi:hypothetical protein